jgi:hypothetical protein
MSTPKPTFLGLDSIAGHLRRSFDEIAVVVVERVLNRNDNAKVANIDLSPGALAAFLPAPGAEPCSGSGEDAHRPLVNLEEQRQAVLAWLRHTFAANMRGEPAVKFKVGLWTAKREKLVGSVRVMVSGLPRAEEPAPPPVRTWELLMPTGERIVTSDPDIVEAHRHLLEATVRSAVVFHEQATETLDILAQSMEVERRQVALGAKARLVLGLPPDHDFMPPERRNVLPFQNPPKP